MISVAPGQRKHFTDDRHDLKDANKHRGDLVPDSFNNRLKDDRPDDFPDPRD